MHIRRTILNLVAFIYIITCSTSSAWAEPNVVGRAAVLIDSKSGKILYAKNADEPLPPASTTKILTAALVLQNCKLTDIVTARQDATLVEPSAIGLKEGEKITVENLLYAMLLKSANDAAIAFADHISGSVSKFTELMNSRARSMGATNSHFTNPNGLPDPNHYTTAHDLAVIAKYAMEIPEFKEIVSAKVKVIPRTDDSAVKWLQNHNKMLWRYEGANGIKTGYTKEAKQCLVVSADKNGQELIAVILGSEGSNIWSDGQTLLDYGFDNYVTYKHKDANVAVQSVAVSKGTEKVTLVTQKAFFYTLPKGNQGSLTEKAVVNSEITAPVKKGQVLGKLFFFLKGKEIGFVNLVAENDAAVRSFSFNGGGSESFNPLLAGGLLLGLFMIWKVRKRKRRKRRVWLNRAIR